MHIFVDKHFMFGNMGISTKGRKKMKYTIEFTNFDMETTTENNVMFDLTYGENTWSVSINNGTVNEFMLDGYTIIEPKHFGLIMLSDGNKVVTVEKLMEHVQYNLSDYIDGERQDYENEHAHRDYVGGIR